MKKLFALLLVLAIGAAAWHFWGGSDSSENVYYQHSFAYIKNGQLIIKGNIINTDYEDHVLGLENAELYITDSEGTEISTVTVNKEFQNALRLKPRSYTPYNLALNEIRYQPDAYSSLTTGLQIKLRGTVHTSKCHGPGCSRCHDACWAELPDHSQPGNGSGYHHHDSYDTPISNERPCIFCDSHHNGMCSACHGTGHLKGLEGSVVGSTCRTCGGSGRCQYCGGDGIND